MEMNYCRRCGGVLSQTQDDTYTCTNGHKIFKNVAATVGVWIITKTGDLLLALRKYDPNKGMLDTPGGFSDGTDTSLEETVMRELKEELNLSPSDYSDLSYVSSHANAYSYGGEFTPTMDIFFRTTLKNEANLQAGDDVASFVIKNIDEIDNSHFAFESIKKSLPILQKTL
jgi:ADP-ribose pyrophosphatase YjhB (NUDIX family)